MVAGGVLPDVAVSSRLRLDFVVEAGEGREPSEEMGDVRLRADALVVGLDAAAAASPRAGAARGCGGGSADNCLYAVASLYACLLTGSMYLAAAPVTAHFGTEGEAADNKHNAQAIDSNK